MREIFRLCIGFGILYVCSRLAEANHERVLFHYLWGAGQFHLISLLISATFLGFCLGILTLLRSQLLLSWKPPETQSPHKASCTPTEKACDPVPKPSDTT